jgi:hypothetical protein
MDYTGLDAIENKIRLLGGCTSRHGQHRRSDHVDSRAVRRLDGSNRVVEIMSLWTHEQQTNHRWFQLAINTSGQKALAIFQLISEEITEMVLGARKRGGCS